MALWWHSIVSTINLYRALFAFETLQASALDQFGDVAIADQWRAAYIVYYGGIILLLLACIVLQRIAWGKRHPQILFLMFAGAVGGLFAQISLSIFGIPDMPSTLIFLAIAVLIPVHWRLHFIYQFLSVAYYFVIYPFTGIATLANDSYNIYTTEIFVEVIFVCLISVLSVYLYERLRRSEFEVNRRLQTFLRSVSHDLKTPVLGTSVVLNSLLQATESSEEIMVKQSTLQQLLNGSNRQLALIHSLHEAYTTEVQGIMLHCEPIELKPLVAAVLGDWHHELNKKRVQLTNRITDGLPLLYADSNQLWRVFSNLIGNSLKHNPHGIQLTLEVAMVEPQHLSRVLARWQRTGISPIQQLPTQGSQLLCVVQDNGQGLSPDQVQRLFEPYTRGTQARYMPGLGLGLYLCKQIITAHGGDIGVVSNPNQGAAFWFTLPIHQARR